jgi:hypothetical protein
MAHVWLSPKAMEMAEMPAYGEGSGGGQTGGANLVSRAALGWREYGRGLRDRVHVIRVFEQTSGSPA